MPISNIVKCRFLCLPLLIVELGAQTAGTSPFKITPAGLSFVQVTNAIAIPAAQTFNVAAISGAGSNATAITVTPPVSQWLTVTPISGTLPATIKVAVNPFSLPVGTYNETVVVTPNGSNPVPVNVQISLQVKSPPSEISLNVETLSFTRRLGDSEAPAQTVNMTTTGGLLSWSAVAAGGTWLSAPLRTGVIFPGFTSTLRVVVATGDLIPGTYKGTITVNAPDAITKTKAVNVNLVIQPGIPALNSVFPAQIAEGSGDTTVTLNGLRFYKDTVFRAAGIVVKATILGPNAATIVIPGSLLTVAGVVTIVASNPNPGGGDSSTYRLIINHGGPIVAAVLNAASYSASDISPGTIITLFGAGLGPQSLTVFDNTQPVIAPALAGTRVLIGGIAAPVFYTSANQVSAIVPFAMPASVPTSVQVEYNGIQSPNVPVNIRTTAPGVFTTTGTGAGQLAAFVMDESTGNIELNNDKAAATKGQILIFYATGEGLNGTPPTDGLIAAQPALAPNPNLRVEIGGAPAEVLYSGPSPGLVFGLVQINVRIPGSAISGKATPVVLRIADGKSQDASINLK